MDRQKQQSSRAASAKRRPIQQSHLSLTQCLEIYPQFFTPQKIAIVQKGVQKITPLPKKFHLIDTLYLSNNNLISLENITQFPNIQHLTLSNNNLDDIEEALHHLSQLPCLSNLTLHGNPMSKTPFYREIVLTHLNTLTVFDGKQVKEGDIQSAHVMIRKFNGVMDILLQNYVELVKLDNFNKKLAIQTELYKQTRRVYNIANLNHYRRLLPEPQITETEVKKMKKSLQEDIQTLQTQIRIQNSSLSDEKLYDQAASQLIIKQQNLIAGICHLIEQNVNNLFRLKQGLERRFEVVEEPQPQSLINKRPRSSSKKILKKSSIQTSNSHQVLPIKKLQFTLENESKRSPARSYLSKQESNRHLYNHCYSSEKKYRSSTENTPQKERAPQPQRLNFEPQPQQETAKFKQPQQQTKKAPQNELQQQYIKELTDTVEAQSQYIAELEKLASQSSIQIQDLQQKLKQQEVDFLERENQLSSKHQDELNGLKEELMKKTHINDEMNDQREDFIIEIAQLQDALHLKQQELQRYIEERQEAEAEKQAEAERAEAERAEAERAAETERQIKPQRDILNAESVLLKNQDSDESQPRQNKEAQEQIINDLQSQLQSQVQNQVQLQDQINQMVSNYQILQEEAENRYAAKEEEIKFLQIKVENLQDELSNNQRDMEEDKAEKIIMSNMMKEAEKKMEASIKMSSEFRLKIEEQQNLIDEYGARIYDQERTIKLQQEKIEECLAILRESSEVYETKLIDYETQNHHLNRTLQERDMYVEDCQRIMKAMEKQIEQQEIDMKRLLRLDEYKERTRRLNFDSRYMPASREDDQTSFSQMISSEREHRTPEHARLRKEFDTKQSSLGVSRLEVQRDKLQNKFQNLQNQLSEILSSNHTGFQSNLTESSFEMYKRMSKPF